MKQVSNNIGRVVTLPPHQLQTAAQGEYWLTPDLIARELPPQLYRQGWYQYSK
jgi:hypothetical protein